MKKFFINRDVIYEKSFKFFVFNSVYRKKKSLITQQTSPIAFASWKPTEILFEKKIIITNNQLIVFFLNYNYFRTSSSYHVPVFQRVKKLSSKLHKYSWLEKINTHTIIVSVFSLSFFIAMWTLFIALILG